MNKASFFGLDFGTSNSTFSVCTHTKRRLLPLEGDKPTLPSVIFFHTEDASELYGRAAMAEYLSGTSGRLMRSLKSVLGTSLMQQETKVGEQYLVFSDIIGMFIARMKAAAEQGARQEIDRIVLGRPVHFVDDNEAADAKAQGQLEQIVHAQGFRHIEFQYEPIAAALDYEQGIEHEEIALIIDMGGGTSDFSIIRLSPEGKKRTDRSKDILANHGVHIGGTDFDKSLSIQEIMPLLGYMSALKEKNLFTPKHVFHDFATWHKINLLYTRQTSSLLADLLAQAKHPELIERLSNVIHEHKGHEIAVIVENAKIALSEHKKHVLDLRIIEEGLALTLTRPQLHNAIEDDVARVIAAIRQTVQEAGIAFSQVQTLVMTGGSTLIPLVRSQIAALFPKATITDGDTFGSVGLGLAVDAQRKFG